MKTELAQLRAFIERDPKLYGVTKDICIVAYLRNKGMELVTPEVVHLILNLERAWRSILSRNPHLDYRKPTKPAEDKVKSDLGYVV